jgi:hypothetical protein
LINSLDLHPKNIAFALPGFDHWAVNDVQDQFGEPDKWPVRRFNGEPIGPEVPPYTVTSAYFWRLGNEKITKDVRIIDFGEASSISEPRTKLHIPMAFCAPAALFDEDVIDWRMYGPLYALSLSSLVRDRFSKYMGRMKTGCLRSKLSSLSLQGHSRVQDASTFIPTPCYG